MLRFDSVPLVFFFFFFKSRIFWQRGASFKKFKVIDLFRLCHAFYRFFLGSKVPLVLKENLFFNQDEAVFNSRSKKICRKTI
jgi:hypothetical protein